MLRCALEVQCCADDVFITGGSGVALGIPRNLHLQGLASEVENSTRAIHGAGAVLCGSCSSATREQVRTHIKQNPSLAIDIDALMSGELDSNAVAGFICDHKDSLPIVYSSSDPLEVSALQRRYGAESIASTLDALFADTARELLSRGYKRLVIAGGETSSAVSLAVFQVLKKEAMRIGREIDPGVPVLYVGGDEPIALALKSGNFGTPDFFAKAFAVISENS